MKGTVTARLRVVVRGAVQGVGFRPFVYRLATELGLPGWVNNSTEGVFIEVEGEEARLRQFLLRLQAEKPPRSFIQSLEPSFLDPVGYAEFTVRPSEKGGAKSAYVLPDIATCDDCLREMLDPSNRRYRYPFTNCTNCGPRFSIIKAVPYDRGNTTMDSFALCTDCRGEYEDPADRRFHAQPNACPVCGPHLELWDSSGSVLCLGDQALLAASDAVRQGRAVAVKGLGGIHLIVDARNKEAVAELRLRKAREEKPFALMAPTLEQARELCGVDDLEARLLGSPEAPIVLLGRRFAADHSIMDVAANVAPGNPHLGVMLPYTPLHHLLMAELRFPVVATSGNRSDEPICTDEREALVRLGGIADLFLVHNRPIHRHVDDSIVRVMAGREMVVRRARGYAPLPIRLKEPQPPLLAVGAHQKSCVAISVGSNVFVSQHLGDLATAEAYEAFTQAAQSLQELYDLRPEGVVCDAHPDYLSSRYAHALGLPVREVQHHFAHAFACMAENGLEGPVLSASWDGTGLGLDGTIWGGEFLTVSASGECERAGHLRTFPLPGGEKAVKEPRRVALGLLYELLGPAALERNKVPSLAAFTGEELGILGALLRRGTQAPRTSSIGRLFDGAASLIGLRQACGFEGQAAMELEFLLTGELPSDHYDVALAQGEGGALVVDWAPVVQGLLSDWGHGVSPRLLSARFHNWLVEALVAVAREVGIERVLLTGGCFQNRYLAERAVHRLREEGLRPYWHQRVPPNDGGIALGQLAAVGSRLRAEG
ncbi:MAG TPA: carbamoyltransferase HypF [Armatimonadota bacterium]